MESQAKELFRLAILRVLDTNRTRFGMGTVAIAHHLAAFSFTASNFASPKAYHDEIADALQYLEDKKLIEEALRVVSRENRSWRITTDGIAFLDSNP